MGKHVGEPLGKKISFHQDDLVPRMCKRVLSVSDEVTGGYSVWKTLVSVSLRVL